VLSTNRKLTPQEIGIIQDEVNKIYAQFMQIVADGRNITVERVNEIARGRVWTGRDAIKIGLVDEMGGLNDAIAYAINQAGIKKPVFAYYPKKSDNKWINLLENYSDQQDKEDNNASKLSQKATELMIMLNDMESMKGIQMRMPFYMDIH
jgi:protease-4